ncbi:synaptonemal complex central element protein 2 [Gastrophryne carolinensis]
MAELEVNGVEAQESGIPSNAKPGPPPVQTSSRSPSPPTPASAGDTGSKSPNYFATLDATVEALQDRAQALIDKINEKRGKDQTLMKNFNTSLSMKVAELSQCLEEQMYQVYQKNNTLMQAKLQELTQIIDRIGQLQVELKQVCHTLMTIYKDLGLEPDV